jgi:polysaccharide export outer membrane protein
MVWVGAARCAKLFTDPSSHLEALMKFGGVSFARRVSQLALLGVLLSGLGFKSLAQQAPASSSPETTTPALPPARPISDAALSSASGKDSAKTAEALESPKPGNSDIQDPSLLRLGAGDLIEVSVYNVPELSTKARIGNTGDVYLPLIDYVHIGDLTVEEAQGLIQKRLEDGGFVRGAHATIFLDESASQGVTILGEVAKPGIYPVLGDRKLYDLISSAGGFSQAAGRKVSIIRLHSSAPPITVNLPRNLADDLQDNVEILPGDTITVPRAPIIYVVGDVGRPAGLLVDNGSLTVLQALALAGGTNHTAKMSGVRIIRKGPTGMTETRLPLKKMLKAKAPDVTLQADDILFVPLSGMRVAASQSMQAAISAATGIAVIAAHP